MEDTMRRTLIFLTYLIVITLIGSIVTADENENGGFWGNIDYQNCDCTGFAYADRVQIQQLPDGTPTYFGVICRSGGDGYDTGETTFPPGTYRFSVVLSTASECDHSQIVQVSHGYSRQQVDLIVYGPGGGGN